MELRKKIRNKLIELKIYKYKKQGMVIGKNCRFTRPVFTVGEPYLVEIGDNVLVSFGVSFLTHDGAIHLVNKEIYDKKVIRFGKIKIGNNCFIGCKSIIMPNVELGDNCIVGAGSVVTKSFPSNSVIAGNPARIITTTDQYCKKCLEETPQYNLDNYIKNKRQEVLKYYNKIKE